MATIKAVVLSRIDKEGMTKVQIAVSHKQVTVYIPTDIKVDPKDFSKGRILRGHGANGKNARIEATINDYKSKLEEMEYVSDMTAQQIKAKLVRSVNKSITFGQAVNAYIGARVTNPATAQGLRTAEKAFVNYCKGQDVVLRTIDKSFVQGFSKFLDTTKNTKGQLYREATKKLIYTNVHSIWTFCRNNGDISDVCDPFTDNPRKFKSTVRDNGLSAEEMLVIRNMEFKTKRKKYVKDLFLLSFYMGGLNMTDIHKLDFRGDKVSFIRSKTARNNYTTTLPVLPQAREILDRVMDKDTGRVFADTNNYTLACAFDVFFSEVRKALNTDRPISFYSARKCFAQIGRNIGISDAIMDYCLQHSPTGRGVIMHYSSIPPELAEEAMKMIYEFADKPDDIRAIFRKNILSNLHG